MRVVSSGFMQLTMWLLNGWWHVNAKQTAAVLTAQDSIAAETHQRKLSISTTCRIFPIIYIRPGDTRKMPLPLGYQGHHLIHGTSGCDPQTYRPRNTGNKTPHRMPAVSSLTRSTQHNCQRKSGWEQQNSKQRCRQSTWECVSVNDSIASSSILNDNVNSEQFQAKFRLNARHKLIYLLLVWFNHWIIHLRLFHLLTMQARSIHMQHTETTTQSLSAFSCDK